MGVGVSCHQKSYVCREGLHETKDRPMDSHPAYEPRSLSLGSLSPPHGDSEHKGEGSSDSPWLPRQRFNSPCVPNLVVRSALGLSVPGGLVVSGRQGAPMNRRALSSTCLCVKGMAKRLLASGQQDGGAPSQRPPSAPLLWWDGRASQQRQIWEK